MRGSLQIALALLLVIWIVFVVVSPIIDLPLTVRISEICICAMAGIFISSVLDVLILCGSAANHHFEPLTTEPRLHNSPMLC